MAIPAPKPILITGATGNQGSAVLSHLLALNAASPTSPPFTLYALTRHPTSAAARALAAKSPTIHLIPGNLDNPTAVFAAIPEPLWGVYSVQLGIGQTQAAEEQQGKALVDAALAHGARHFVYSSAARLAESRVRVAQFESKAAIEAYLKARAGQGEGEGKALGEAEAEAEAEEGMTYTILQPTGFFENMKPGFQGAVFAGILRYNLPRGYKLGFISTDDIGWFAAQAFLRPEAPEYRNASIVLAGDKLSFDDAKSIYEEKMGEKLPLPVGGRLFPFLVTGLFVRELGELFRYFSQQEYEVDIAALRKLYPGLKDFVAWLEAGRRGSTAAWAR